MDCQAKGIAVSVELESPGFLGIEICNNERSYGPTTPDLCRGDHGLGQIHDCALAGPAVLSGRHPGATGT